MNNERHSQADTLQQDDEVDLVGIFRVIWRGKWFLLFFALLGSVAAGYHALFVATPYYSTTAMVVQETDQEPVVDFGAALGGAGLSGGADQSAINTEIEVLRSRGLLEKLVANLELVKDPEFNPEIRPVEFWSVGNALNTVQELSGIALPEKKELNEQEIIDQVVDTLREALSISNIRQSYVYQISVTTEDPYKSALLANTLSELYILNQLDVKSEANAMAMVWLTDRVSQLRLELEEAETAVKNFNAATDLINEETLAALNRQVKELRERLSAEKKAVAEVNASLLIMQNGSADLEQIAFVADDRLLNNMLADFRADPEKGTERFDNRLAQVIRQKTLEAQRRAAQIVSLEASIIAQEEATDQQSDDLLMLQQLEREAAASGLLYEFFLGRLKETSVQAGVQQAESRVLSRAVVPQDASSPRTGLSVVVGFFIATLLGVGILMLREFSQTAFRAAEDLEAKTGLTVLGQIPRISAGRRAKVIKYLNDKPTSIAAEAVRNLRTSILLSDKHTPPQVIMSTSSIPGEGKTTQSLALAHNLAGLNKKVLLVEGDLRKLVFAEYFNIKGKQGLLSVMDGSVTIEDAAVLEPGLSADVLIGEKPSANAADIFSSQAFVQFIKDMRERYDYIIIDTPPVLAVPDARVIGRQADAVIYTVKWDSTTERQVTEGLKSLRNVGVTVTGLVLSQINLKRQQRYGYGDTAGKYGSYHVN